jgi:hypothetical protein
MHIRTGSGEARLPDFLIVGAARAGTTTIYQYLTTHPEVFMPRFKEPSFFYFLKNPRAQGETHSKEYIWHLEQYAELFRGAPGNATVGEASTVYLQEAETVIANISDVYGQRMNDIAIVVVLREPVARALSMYAHMVQSGREDMAFEMAVQPEIVSHRVRRAGRGFDYVRGSQYSGALRRYMEVFDNVTVLFYDQLVERRADLLRELCRFLSINPALLTTRPIVSNSSGRVRRDIWGRMFELKKAVGRSPAKAVINRWVPRSLLLRLGDAIHARGISRDPVDEQYYRDTCGSLFSGDLLDLADLFREHNMRTHSSVVKKWLEAYR